MCSYTPHSVISGLFGALAWITRHLYITPQSGCQLEWHLPLRTRCPLVFIYHWCNGFECSCSRWKKLRRRALNDRLMSTLLHGNARYSLPRPCPAPSQARHYQILGLLWYTTCYPTIFWFETLNCKLKTHNHYHKRPAIVHLYTLIVNQYIRTINFHKDTQNFILLICSTSKLGI